MSTTFYVYPSTDIIPTFEQLLEVATGHLTDFLRSYGIMVTVRLDVGMRRNI